MSAFDKNGNAISSVYDSEGTLIGECYDKNANPILDGKLSIMTYNVQWFTLLNADDVMQNRILNEYKPVLLGIQEFMTNRIPSVGMTILSPRYKNIVVGEQYNKTAIATNFKLSNVQYHDFEHIATYQYGFQSAVFKFKGRDVLWVNAHIETTENEEVKLQQAAEIYDYVKDKAPFIITADFNTTCKNTQATEYTEIMKPFVDLGCSCANCTEQFGFTNTWFYYSVPTGGPDYPCDHIIASSDFVMTNVERDEIKLGYAEEYDMSIDHVALTCELDFATT